jgi:hypothetical protein
MNRLAGVVLLLVVAASQVQAQSTSADLRDTVQGTVDIQKRTQEERNAWATEQAELEARYRTAKANVRYLAEHISVREREVVGLEESTAELERRMHESRLLQTSLQDTLNVIMARLEGSVARDLPFLRDEREHRLASLGEEFARPEVTGAEKLRRLLEAMQVEMEYGKTVDVSQEEILLDGEPIFVDVLRVGRLALFWRTPDGAKTGTFDRATWTWVELPDKYGRTIARAIEMASRIRPVQLIALPLGRIRP